MADAIRADADADLAIVNAGGVRGDRVYPAEASRKRTLLAMHPFGNVICKIEAPGRVVVRALGQSKLPASAGQFPQVSGLTMRVDERAPPGKRVRDVLVEGKPIDPSAALATLAIPDYVLKGGDGYAMFAGQKVLIAPEVGDLISDALMKAVAEKKIIAPSIEGRIVID